MAHPFQSRGFFAAVAVLFVATTWLNWSIPVSDGPANATATIQGVSSR
jgi:hypothetical protein